jgi:death-on-curing protein
VSVIEALDLDDALHLARRLLGDPLPDHDPGLLAAALARPLASVDGKDVSPTVWHQAAALLELLLLTRPFGEHTARVAWLVTATYVEINGASLAGARSDDVRDLLDSLDRDRITTAAIARRLEQLGRRRFRPPAAR